MKKNSSVMKLLFVITVLSVFDISFSDTTAAPKTTITDSSQIIADRIIQSKIPVVIDFWAVWCGPCKMLNPVMAELEKEYRGKVSFVKVNVDIHKSLAAYFQVNAIPAVFIVQNKTVVKFLQGLQPKEAYKDAINEVLALAKNSKAASDSTKNRKSVPDSTKKSKAVPDSTKK